MTEQEAINEIRNRECVECIGNEIGCGSCSYKVAINALEEIQQYRELEQKLNGVDFTMLVNHFMEMAAEGEIQGYQRGRILTNDDADKWDAYLAIGTPDECRAAVEKQKAKKPIIEHENTSDCVTEVEWKCPICGTNYIELTPCGEWCRYCGTKLDWGDEKCGTHTTMCEI